MYFYDTETCGLHGMPVLIQYAKSRDDEIVLHEIWYAPVHETLSLIRSMMEEGTIGFNLAFDQFQLCKLYTIWLLLPPDWIPVDHIEEIAHYEPLGRDGPCVKPAHCLDLMMYARKGPYQSTMDRKAVVIRRVPVQIAATLLAELESRVELKDIYFAKRKDKRAAKWVVQDCKDRDTGAIDPNFVNIVLKFRPSSSLKAIAEDMFGGTMTKFKDVDVEERYRPDEVGFAPFALAIDQDGYFRTSWPAMIRHHIKHWRYMPSARRYAANDVTITRDIYYAWGEPELDDDDSVLCCMVAACRWRGYAIDVAGVKALREEKLQLMKAAPRSRQRVMGWIWPDLSDADKLLTKGSTAKIVLEDMAKWKQDDGVSEHPAAPKARLVLDARKAASEIILYDKLLLAGRFHASFIVIGALSSRMSGGDGDLNSQGIKKTKEVRSKFPLAFTGGSACGIAASAQQLPPSVNEMFLAERKAALNLDLSRYHPDTIEFILCGGDFESFEVTIADAVWGDPKLHEDLQNGKSIHGIFGTFVYPDLTYEQIMASKGSKVFDYYTRCKSAVFAMLYGGEGYTLKTRLGVDIETADRAHAEFASTYHCIRLQQDMLTAKFCTLKQPTAGGRVIWSDPDDYIESAFGDRRYFTVENKITKILFDLSEKPPPAWNKFTEKVVRTKLKDENGGTFDKVQKVSGAVRSALYGAAFNMQGSNKRAAGNHLIQSAGARITKRVQAEIWSVQPSGVNPWLVQPMNIHDEIMCPVRVTDQRLTSGRTVVEEVQHLVDTQVAKFREQIPLLGLGWSTGLSNWADK